MVCFKAGELPVTCQDSENELEKDYSEIWTATGEVPKKLAEAPPAPLYLSYNGKKVSPNDTANNEVEGRGRSSVHHHPHRLWDQTFEWLAVLPLD